jgi:hypothetical protein
MPQLPSDGSYNSEVELSCRLCYRCILDLLLSRLR